MDLEVNHSDDGNRGKFYIEVNGQQEAEMTYVWAGSEMFIIDHTEVNDALRGQSAGKKMVFAAVDFARQNQKKIKPLCPFAKSVFDRYLEIRDVLK